MMGQEANLSTKALIERLREHAAAPSFVRGVREDMTEAAATLERVERERDEARKAAASHDEDAQGLARMCNVLSERRVAAEAQVETLRKALKACRTNIAGYNLRDGTEAPRLVDEFFNELQRIHKVAEAALSAPAEERKAECCMAPECRVEGYCLYQQRSCAGAEESSAQPGWQSFATAPRDGKPFLTFTPDDTFSAITGIEVMWFDSQLGLVYGPDCTEPVFKPTHWMPLPGAPTGRSQ